MINDKLELRPENTELSSFDRNPMPTLRDLLSVLFRQRWVMVLTFGVVILAVAVSGVWLPKYEAHLKILVRHPRTEPTATPWANSPAMFSDNQVTEEDLNSEVELLNSADLLRKVVLTTGLAGPNAPGTDSPSEVKIAKAVGKLGSNLKIEALHKSNVISASYASRNPQMAASVLKALSAAYAEKHLEMVRSTGDFKFFDQQTAQYRQGLDEAQQRLSEFNKETGVVSAPIERDATLQRANEFDFNAHQAQATVQETQQRIRTLQAQLQSVKPRMTTQVRTSENPQLMQQLKSTLLNLELKRTELLTKYDPSHRLVQEVDQQIAEAHSAINAEETKPSREETTDQDPNYQWIQSELTKAQTDLSGLIARASASRSMADQYHQQARQFDRSGVQQQDLERAVKIQQDNYDLYQHKREEARINAALDERGILDVSVSEQPIVPALPARSLMLVGLIAIIVGVLACIFAAFVADSTDPTFRTPEELAAYLGAPVLASLPSVAALRGPIFAALPRSGE